MRLRVLLPPLAVLLGAALTRMRRPRNRPERRLSETTRRSPGGHRAAALAGTPPVGGPWRGGLTTRRMPRSRLRLLPLGVALALTLSAPGTAVARVPQGFVGVVADGPLFNPSVDLGHQFDVMVASGVESVRTVFTWGAAQPYKTWADVPADQASEFDHDAVPTSFTATDRIVGLAAQRGLQVLPVVMYAPSWNLMPRPAGTAQPASDGPYAAYLALLVNRYGPNGTFWRENPSVPKIPIRMWQIWNEPVHYPAWTTKPFWRTYVPLLRAAHAAIKRADPGAKVVLAGFANYSWAAIRSIYAVPGARRLFDIVAVHPYTAQPKGVITILQRVRGVMSRFGDSSKAILATEVGWPSSRSRVSASDPFQTTTAGQASNVAQLLSLLDRYRHRLRLLGFDYYTWAGHEYPSATNFNYSGLSRFNGGQFVAKPALFEFRRYALALEACRKKGSLATVCLAAS